VRQQAALVGHDLRWRDDLVGSITDEKRATPPDVQEVPAIAFTRSGRIVAATFDISVVVGMAALMVPSIGLGWTVSLAIAALAYHTVSLIAIGSTPAVWAIETFLTHRHPVTTRSAKLRFLRLLHRSDSRL
jgi:hypothetical protein